LNAGTLEFVGKDRFPAEASLFLRQQNGDGHHSTGLLFYLFILLQCLRTLRNSKTKSKHGTAMQSLPQRDTAMSWISQTLICKLHQEPQTFVTTWWPLEGHPTPVFQDFVKIG